MTEPHIIIIGSGMAGYTLLRELRKLDPSIKISLICADSGDFYSKPMLSNALQKNKPPAALIMQDAQQMIDTLDFNLFNHTLITSIDCDRQQINSPIYSWNYSQLILATGARSFALPIRGSAASEILSINSLDDYRLFYRKLKQAERIAIIGPGLIGCEFANDLISANKQVTVIGPDRWPISNLLPEPVGFFLQQRLQQQGVDFQLNHHVKQADKSTDGYRIVLDDDTELHADLILRAVGLRANIDLAGDGAIDTARAYLTDSYLQTSVKNIFALGDCAEVNGLHLPFILPIMHGARALAKTLSGDKTAVSYPPMPVAIKTPACPLVVSPPATRQGIDWRINSSAQGISALCYQQDRLIGFALAGDAITEKQPLTALLAASV